MLIWYSGGSVAPAWGFPPSLRPTQTAAVCWAFLLSPCSSITCSPSHQTTFSPQQLEMEMANLINGITLNLIMDALQNMLSIILTKFQKTMLHQRKPWKPKKRKQTAWLHPDSQSAAWVMSVIRSGCWICHVLLARWWLSTGGRGVGVWRWWRGNDTADEIHDTLSQNLVDWLHV